MLTQAIQSSTSRPRVNQESKPKQLSIEATTTEPNLASSLGLAQSSPNTQILISKEIEELTGITRKRLELANKNHRFPLQQGNYTVIRWAGKQEKSPFSNLWEVQEIN